MSWLTHLWIWQCVQHVYTLTKHYWFNAIPACYMCLVSYSCSWSLDHKLQAIYCIVIVNWFCWCGQMIWTCLLLKLQVRQDMTLLVDHRPVLWCLQTYFKKTFLVLVLIIEKGSWNQFSVWPCFSCKWKLSRIQKSLRIHYIITSLFVISFRFWQLQLDVSDVRDIQTKKRSSNCKKKSCSVLV